MAERGDIISFILPADMIYDLMHEDNLALNLPEGIKVGIDVKEITPVESTDDEETALEVTAVVQWVEEIEEEAQPA
jgi:hypothetical protein